MSNTHVYCGHSCDETLSQFIQNAQILKAHLIESQLTLPVLMASALAAPNRPLPLKKTTFVPAIIST